LPERQVAKLDAANSYALEAADAQPHQFAHAPDLAFLAFAQHETQLIGVLPRDLRRLERGAVQAQPVVQQPQSLVVKPAVHAHQVFFLDRRVLADQQFGNASILGEHQQAGGIDVETAGRRQPPEVFAGKALCRRVRSVMRGRGNQGDRRPVAILGLRGNITYRFVQQDGYPWQGFSTLVEGDGLRRVDARAELSDFDAVYIDPATFVVFAGFTPGA